MSTTLTYGRKKPSDGDRGSTFWDELANNIALDDAHSHNGIDSPQLSTTAILTGTSTVSNSGWTADGSWYYKTITMPVGWTWGNCQISFFLNGGANSGEQIFPKTEYVNSTSYKLYMPMGDQAVNVLYT